MAPNSAARLRNAFADSPNGIWAAVGLLGFALVLRFPFFFEAVIDWDESTFILMGQSLLAGDLPYTNLWDLKPPLTVASFALFIAVLGQSIVGIRLAGTLCVAATAWLSYDITQRHWGQRAGILAGGFCTLLMSLMPGGQSTMTETVAVLPLMVAISLLTRSTTVPLGRTFWISGWLAIAALIRLNLLYVSVAVGILLLALALRQPVKRLLAKAIAFCLGHWLVLGLTWLPYGLQGLSSLWWRSVVQAPLAYANTRSSMGQALVQQGLGLVAIHHNLTGLLGLCIWGGAIATSGYGLMRWRQLSPHQRHTLTALWVVTGATTLSILRSGATHGHYLIQLAPWVSVLAAWGWSELWQHRRLRLMGMVAIAAAVTLSISTLTAGAYGTLAGRLIAGRGLASGPAHGVAAYLTEHAQPEDTAYLLVDHIAYWLTDTHPLTPCTTHPSNLTKPELLPYCSGEAMATPESELTKVLALQPRFIVTLRQPPWYFQGYDNLAQQLDQVLTQDYASVEEIADRVIYQRRTPAPVS
jgi:4-amino-4-deoxy-L-arabinose transferase-like glycosyltransferase